MEGKWKKHKKNEYEDLFLIPLKQKEGETSFMQ